MVDLLVLWMAPSLNGWILDRLLADWGNSFLVCCMIGWQFDGLDITKICCLSDWFVGPMVG